VLVEIQLSFWGVLINQSLRSCQNEDRMSFSRWRLGRLSLSPPASHFKEKAIAGVVLGILFALTAVVIRGLVAEHTDRPELVE